MRETRSSLRPPIYELRLLNAFEVVCDGASVELPLGAQRLVAFVALRRRPVRREYAAGMLWLDVSDERAAANLRSTLWRIQKLTPQLLDTAGGRLCLASDVQIDLHAAEQAAHGVLAGASDRPDLRLFAADVLPDWYDEWLVLERERFRQFRLSALEELCERWTTAGRLGEALELGLLSVAGEPLRESAHRALIRVHIATGNAAEALRQYGVCRRLLYDQLGIEPTQQLRELIDALGT
ncbi:MAG TPA: BTAD domain-containing putative transcriptional regulator [Gaiellaceae bacterium]|jgi:DNA-binding SARP family transcriptional activator